KEVPGTAALNQTGFAAVNSVSCTSPGNCTAGGEYNDASDRGQAFTVTQTGGTWAKAKEVPGIATLNTSGNATGVAVLCASAGTCSADGSSDVNLRSVPNQGQVFVANEANGTWGRAREIPGTAALNTGGNAGVAWVSCASAGNCSADGSYTDG